MTQVAFVSVKAETERINNLANSSSGIDQMVNRRTNHWGPDAVLENGFILLDWDIVDLVLFVVEVERYKKYYEYR